jgi:hypothetical protein
MGRSDHRKMSDLRSSSLISARPAPLLDAAAPVSPMIAAPELRPAAAPPVLEESTELLRHWPCPDPPPALPAWLLDLLSCCILRPGLVGPLPALDLAAGDRGGVVPPIGDRPLVGVPGVDPRAAYEPVRCREVLRVGVTCLLAPLLVTLGSREMEEVRERGGVRERDARPSLLVPLPLRDGDRLLRLALICALAAPYTATAAVAEGCQPDPETLPEEGITDAYVPDPAALSLAELASHCCLDPCRLRLPDPRVCVGPWRLVAAGDTAATPPLLPVAPPTPVNPENPVS